MSNVYNLEPPTKGKVVLRTSLGDIDIELWAKEAPKAVRNFVQLCLEGYYDGTIFHRVIKDFMVQGGDPTGTGTGGESIYGRPFKDEIHSRLRFTHRGLLACANRNEPHTNGSQFFITLDAAPQIDRKYTIFGRVAGDTLYNLLRFNDLEVDKADRPEEPPTLRRADVLWNPFEDIVPRMDREAREAAAAEAKQKVVKSTAQRKAAKNFSLISFGDEAEAEEEQVVAPLHIASAHDALEDPSLAKEAGVDVDLNKVREAMRAAKRQHQEQMGVEHVALDKDAAYEAAHPHMSALEVRMRERVLARREKDVHLSGEASTQVPHHQEDDDNEASAQPSGRVTERPSTHDSDEEEGSSAEEENVKPFEGTGRGRKSTAAVVVPSRQIAVANSELLTAWERRRQEYKERKRIGGHRQRDTLAKLQKFTQGLHHDAAPSSGRPAEEATTAIPAPQEETGGGYSGKVRRDIDHAAYMPAAWRVDEYLDNDADDDIASLRAHRLAFAKEARDAMARKESADDYVVHDPLLEAGKAKFNKRAHAEKKRENQWAGRANV